MAYTFGVICDIGVGPEQGGRQRNEDNYLIGYDGSVRSQRDQVETVEDQPGDGALLAVCDGMGGHDFGHVASTTAVSVLGKLYQPGAPKRPAKVLLKYVQDAHHQLYWAARNDGPVTMGTTLTAAWLIQGKAAWAHVGDSRLYLFRNGRLFQLTSDQTRNEFARRDGRPVSAEGDHLCQNFIYGSRGLGDNTTLRLEHGVDSGAEVLHEGDRLMLCTDGLTCSVDDPTIARILGEDGEPQQAAEQLDALARQFGSRDNITVVVVRVDRVPDEDLDEWQDEGEETLRF